LLVKPAYPTPTWYQLLGFRMSRTMIMQTNPEWVDHQYYADRGWFESDYYYPTHLGVLKRAAGRLAERMVPMVQKLFA
jgi:hypothetical protein